MKIYSHTVALQADLLDAFCALQGNYADQFVFYDKAPLDQGSKRLMGLGRCIALRSPQEADCILDGPEATQPIFFSFNRFDEFNPAPADPLMQSFPHVKFMLPEVVLMQTAQGVFLQINSLGPVYEGRIKRFVDLAQEAPTHQANPIRVTAEEGSFEEWLQIMEQTLAKIEQGSARKIVPSRRIKVHADQPFSSVDVLINLVDGPMQGTVFMYRYDNVFFCGCTPELLVRKRGAQVESMCLAGTAPAGDSPEERERFAAELFADEKNRSEHAYVVEFVRQVLERNCYNVEIPDEPQVVALKQLQHLYTSAHAEVMDGVTLSALASQLHPTPALAGAPVGEAKMALRQIEPYNRGFFGGTVGHVDAAGDGEFAVAIRCGVFDGQQGYLYAGCGVVEGSDAQSEFEETALKFQTLLSALG